MEEKPKVSANSREKIKLQTILDRIIGLLNMVAFEQSVRELSGKQWAKWFYEQIEDLEEQIKKL